MSQSAHSSHNRRKDYLVVATVGSVTRRIIWNDHELLPLDFPPGWTLGKVGSKICLFDQTIPDFKIMEKHALFTKELSENQRMVVQLPAAYQGHPNRALDVTLIPLAPLQPPYMQTDLSDLDPGVPRQLMLYQGVRYFLLKYRPVGRKLTAKSTSGSIFTYEHTGQGFVVTAHVNGFSCKTNGKKVPVPVGQAHLFSENEFYQAVFTHGIFWWRFRSVQTPESLPPIETEDSEEDLREEKRFEKTSIVVISALLSLFIAMAIIGPKEETKAPTIVTLQQPKVIPHQEIFKKPEPPPKPVVEVPPPPKPKPKPPEPPKKVAEPKKIAPPKVVHTPKPPAPIPHKPVAPEVVKHPVEKPPPQVRASTPPATGVVVQKTPAPPVDQSAEVLKSLSFLSTNSKASSKGAVSYSANSKKDFMASPTLGGGSKDSKVLDSMSSIAGDSNIKTKSSRMVSSDVNFGGKAGKGLNEVEGKVSSNQLHGNGVGLSGASGVAVSGPGDLSEAEIEKALQKYLSKFQFCYEKALITDSSLGGNVRLQWNIETSGNVSTSKVVSSQMNNAQLHSCILGVLGTVKFPSPRGGAVTAKKTFNFKASQI